jgi:hypothetical protein
MRIGRGVLLFLAIIFTISGAKGDNSCSGLFGKPVQQTCKQDFCEAYASAAITTVQLAIQNGCVKADDHEGRWDRSKDNHLNACLSWATDSRNGGMAAMNETYWRAQTVSECLAQKAGVPSPLHFTGHGPFTGDDNPTLDSFCGGYAFTAGQQIAAHVQGDRVIASVQLCPEFIKPRWDPDFSHHSQACVSWGNQDGSTAGERSANETTARTQGVIACEVRNITPTPVVTPPPATATVGKEVTMYNACQGNDLCYLNPGDTLTVVQNPAAGAGCGDPHWIKLTGTSGQSYEQDVFVSIGSGAAPWERQ